MHIRHVGAVLICTALACTAAGAQEGFSIAESAIPPVSEQSADATRIVARSGSASQMDYALRITGDPADKTRMQVRAPDASVPAISKPGSVPTAVVVVLVVVALLLFLRFGGAGILMRRSPEPGKDPEISAPDDWSISEAERAADPRRLLADIAAMQDKGQALVRLLRHCLLRAATETDTRFARADTERSAFRRLPTSWRQASALSGVLTQTELAHYGGRAVDPSAFDNAIAAGRAILLKQDQAVA